MSLFGNGGYEKCHLFSDCKDLPYMKKVPVSKWGKPDMFFAKSFLNSFDHAIWKIDVFVIYIN